jgi:hypothetical protein
MSTPARANVRLVDVENTLLDNDRVAADLRYMLVVEVGLERRDRYWAIFEQLRAEPGYADCRRGTSPSSGLAFCSITTLRRYSMPRTAALVNTPQCGGSVQ